MLYDPVLELTKLHVAIGLRKSGHDFGLATLITPGLISLAADMCDPVVTVPSPTDPTPAPTPAPAPAGGGFLAALLAFLSSPQGQALIAMIIQLIISGGHVALLALIGPHKCDCIYNPETGLFSGE